MTGSLCFAHYALCRSSWEAWRVWVRGKIFWIASASQKELWPLIAWPEPLSMRQSSLFSGNRGKLFSMLVESTLSPEQLLSELYFGLRLSDCRSDLYIPVFNLQNEFRLQRAISTFKRRHHCIVTILSGHLKCWVISNSSDKQCRLLALSEIVAFCCCAILGSVVVLFGSFVIISGEMKKHKAIIASVQCWVLLLLLNEVAKCIAWEMDLASKLFMCSWHQKRLPSQTASISFLVE